MFLKLLSFEFFSWIKNVSEGYLFDILDACLNCFLASLQSLLNNFLGFLVLKLFCFLLVGLL